MKCRCCGAALSSYTQTYEPYDIPSRVVVTCPTQPDVCPMGLQTVLAEGYAEKDITPYLETFERNQLAAQRLCEAVVS